MRFLVYIAAFAFMLQDAISQEYIYVMHQDKGNLKSYQPEIIYRSGAGRIFLGSKKGLLSYDGDHLQHFEKKDGTSEHVTAITQYKSGLLLGYADGTVYLFEQNKIQTNSRNFGFEKGWPTTPIKKLILNNDGNIWIATYGEGVFIFNGVYLTNLNQTDGLSDNDIYDMVAGKNGHVYLATDHGIQVCKINDTDKQIYLLPNPSTKAPVVQSLLLDDNSGKLWAGSYESGVLEWDLSDGKFIRQFLPGRNISCIQQAGGDKLLVLFSNQQGIKSWGEVDLSSGSLDNLPAPNGSNSIPVYLIRDEDNLVWMLTSGPELIHFHPGIESVQTPQVDIQAIATVRTDVYIGAEKGLYLLRNGTIRKTPVNENILSIVWIPVLNELWCGTFGNGIVRWSMATGSKKYLTEKDGLTNNSVLSLKRRGDKVLAGTLGGVSIIDLSEMSIQTRTSEDGLTTGYVYTVFNDSQDNIWIGTDGRGVFKKENNEVAGNWLKNESIYAIAQDSMDVIWLAAGSKKLAYIRNGEFIFPTGLSGRNWLSISGTGTRWLLASHEEGLCLIDPVQGSLTDLTKSTGSIPFLNLNTLSPVSDGIIWAGGKGAMVRLNINLMKFHKPYIEILSATAGKQPLKSDTIFRLRHDQNTFEISYAAFWPDNPEAVTFRYQMEGYDKDWISTLDRKLIYPNLPPGTYRFKLQVLLKGAFESSEVLYLDLHILPPFYKTWWFYLIAIVCIFAMIGGGVYWTIERRDRINQLRTEQVKNQLETLKSQINPHFLFNSFNTLIGLIEESPGHAVQYVNRLSDFYRSILTYREKDLIHLDEELELFENYQYLLKMRFGSGIQIEIDQNPDLKGGIIPLTIQMLVENAVKHNIVSRSKPLYIQIFIGEKFVTITNNLQLKSNKEPSTGFGISSLESRYMLLTGRAPKIIQSPRSYSVSVPIQPEIS